MKKSPAFQFYPNDWLSSPTTNTMTAEQEGAYIRLLCFCWQDNDISLLDDDDYLSVLSRISKGGLRVVKNAFNQHPTKPGYLTHERLIKEHNIQVAWREKSSKGGKKSVEIKRNFKGGSTTPQPKVNSSSSSSSSSKGKVKKESVVGSRFTLTDPPSDWIDFCQTQRPELNVGLTFDSFRDYWLAKAGRDGVKLDWAATWRNWVRNQKQQSNGGTNGQQKSRTERAMEAARRGGDSARKSWGSDIS